MELERFLDGVTIREACLIIAAIAAFIAVLLTIIHYVSGVVVGVSLGVASDAGLFGSMMQEYWRDVLLPFLIALGSFLIFLIGQMYVLTQEWAITQGYL